MGQDNIPPIVSTMAEKSGLAPGSLVPVGEAVQTRQCQVILYQSGRSNKLPEPVDLTKLQPPVNSKTWIHMSGLADPNAVKEIGELFNLHHLVQEDILNARHRPKLEELDNGFYLILRAIEFGEDARLKYNQVNLIFQPGTLISCTERAYPPFTRVEKRLLGGHARALRLGADYLMYRLCDLVVDRYFNALEAMEDHLEGLSERAENEEGPAVLASLQTLRRELQSFRKYVIPLREMVVELQRNDADLISDECLPFLRDLNDHILQVLDRIESLREQTSSLIEYHLALVSHRMNEVMKVLTVIATIFIPLTFIAGIYGMNFELMPELKWRWGYAAVWTLMIVVGIIMVIWFRRRRWF